MSFDLWLAFTLVAAVLLAMPGPTILLVTGFAIRYVTRAALGTVAGVVAGDVLAMSLSLAGVGALLAGRVRHGLADPRRLGGANRTGGSLLIGAGMLTAMRRRP